MHNAPATTPARPSRRTVVSAVAWSTPAVLIATAIPAAATSTPVARCQPLPVDPDTWAMERQNIRDNAQPDWAQWDHGAWYLNNSYDNASGTENGLLASYLTFPVLAGKFYEFTFKAYGSRGGLGSGISAQDDQSMGHRMEVFIGLTYASAPTGFSMYTRPAFSHPGDEHSDVIAGDSWRQRTISYEAPANGTAVVGVRMLLAPTPNNEVNDDLFLEIVSLSQCDEPA